MNLRDLDLVVAGALIAVGTVLSRMAEPASAIVLLALLVSLAIIAIGEERLGMLWHAYSRERDAVSYARTRSSVTSSSLQRARQRNTSTWEARHDAKLAPARVVLPGERTLRTS